MPMGIESKFETKDLKKVQIEQEIFIEKISMIS